MTDKTLHRKLQKKAKRLRYSKCPHCDLNRNAVVDGSTIILRCGNGHIEQRTWSGGENGRRISEIDILRSRGNARTGSTPVPTSISKENIQLLTFFLLPPSTIAELIRREKVGEIRKEHRTPLLTYLFDKRLEYAVSLLETPS